MDWLKKHFDRVILAVMGIIVIACAGLIISRTLSFSDIFAETKTPPRRNDNVPPPATELVKQRISAIEKPRDWGTHEGSLFVSDPYVIKDNNDKPLNPLEDEEPLYPPIPNKWIKQYGLDFGDPNLPNADPDGDKFSNLEEFNGKTDPTNPKSMPAYITKLRLLEFIQVPFRLKFSGSPDEGTYSINTMDLRGPTQFLKIGEMVAGTPYKLVKYEHKTMDKEGLEVDVSELTVENQNTGQKIVLVNDKPVNDPTVYARFKYLWDGSEFKVKKNDSFSVKPEETIKYKLIDISDSEAVIESPQGAKIQVPKGTP
jgi:hypothetical protein